MLFRHYLPEITFVAVDHMYEIHLILYFLIDQVMIVCLSFSYYKWSYFEILCQEYLQLCKHQDVHEKLPYVVASSSSQITAF